MKTALIFDLDNTIYPVSAIADNLFRKLFAVLDEYSGTINLGDDDRVLRLRRRYPVVPVRGDPLGRCGRQERFG